MSIPAPLEEKPDTASPAPGHANVTPKSVAEPLAAARTPATPLGPLRAAIDRRSYLALVAVGLLGPLLTWWLVAGFAGVDPVFLPAPAQVLKRLFVWYTQENLLDDIGISVCRVVGGWLLSAVIAFPMGLYIGSFARVQALLEPLTDLVRYMPAVAFVPLIMLWVGIDETAKVAVIFIGTFFQMVLMVAEDVRRVPLAQIEAGMTMGANRRELIEKVILPSAKPALLDTLRLTMGWAWTYLVVAELVAADSGVGFAIIKAQRFLQTDKIFAGILLIGLLGLAMDQGFRLLHRRAFPWLHRAR